MVDASIHHIWISVDAQIEENETSDIDVVGLEHDAYLLASGVEFSQAVEVADKLCRIIIGSGSVCVYGYLFGSD